MGSPKPILISPKALQELDETYAWIDNKFGKLTLQAFHNKWAAFLNLVALHPTIFPFINKKKGLRKFTLYKRNLIVYKNKRTHIEIVSVFNTWQNPKRLNKI
jgi:plasmid stabilization system protein ParE